MVFQNSKKDRTGDAHNTSNGAPRAAKDRLVSIRLNHTDIEKIKEKALGMGIPYQTLIGCILHVFAEGKLDIHF